MRRLNCRHQLWGHLFGGRYRSILVENADCGGKVWRDYLRTVIDYVHMNPGRAGLVDGNEKSVLDYEWSSLAQGYALSPGKRPKWMAAGEGLDLHGEKDTVKGRRNYLARLDQWTQDGKGDLMVEGVSLSAQMKRGWHWGSEGFKEAMLSRYEKMKKGGNRTYASSPLAKDHGERKAEAILKKAQEHYGIKIEKLREKKQGDRKRVSVAWAIAGNTTMSQSWISEVLGMKTPANVSQQIRRFAAIPEKELKKPVRAWKKSIFVD